MKTSNSSASCKCSSHYLQMVLTPQEMFAPSVLARMKQVYNRIRFRIYRCYSRCLMTVAATTGPGEIRFCIDSTACCGLDMFNLERRRGTERRRSAIFTPSTCPCLNGTTECKAFTRFRHRGGGVYLRRPLVPENECREFAPSVQEESDGEHSMLPSPEP